MSRNKLLYGLVALLAGGIVFLALWASPLPIQNLWVVERGEDKDFSLSTQGVRELSDKEIVSYHNIRDGMVEALGHTTPVDVVETNTDYAFIFNFPLLSGSFVLEEDWVVLNQAAAHKLFYSTQLGEAGLKLDGVFKRVVGVVEDGAKDPRLYTVSPKGGLSTPYLFFSSSPKSSLTLSELSSLLQDLGVVGIPYTLVNLAQSQKIMKGLPVILCLLLGAYAAGLLFKRLYKGLKEKLAGWEKEKEDYQFKDWLTQQEGGISGFFRPLLPLATTFCLGCGLLFYSAKRLFPLGEILSPLYKFKGKGFPSWGISFKGLFFLQISFLLVIVLLLLCRLRKKE